MCAQAEKDDRVKQCGQCQIEKGAPDFHKDERNPDGLSSKCKECRRAGQKQVRPRGGGGGKHDCISMEGRLPCTPEPYPGRLVSWVPGRDPEVPL